MTITLQDIKQHAFSIVQNWEDAEDIGIEVYKQLITGKLPATYARRKTKQIALNIVKSHQFRFCDNNFDFSYMADTSLDAFAAFGLQEAIEHSFNELQKINAYGASLLRSHAVHGTSILDMAITLGKTKMHIYHNLETAKQQFINIYANC